MDDESLLLMVAIDGNLKSSLVPAKPMAQVWVSNGYLTLDLYLYLPNPYLCTCMGLQTRDMH
jgi:hypothetical protein